MAMEIKSDGKGCPYKLLEVGHTDGENYEAELAAAKPMTDIFAIPMVTSDPHFKENLALAKFRNQVTIEDAKVDAKMYDTLAAALGEPLMRLFTKSTWAKHQGLHTFVELYAYVHSRPTLNPLFYRLRTLLSSNFKGSKICEVFRF